MFVFFFSYDCSQIVQKNITVQQCIEVSMRHCLAIFRAFFFFGLTGLFCPLSKGRVFSPIQILLYFTGHHYAKFFSEVISASGISSTYCLNFEILGLDILKRYIPLLYKLEDFIEIFSLRKTVSPHVQNYGNFSRFFEIANQLLARHSPYLAP